MDNQEYLKISKEIRNYKIARMNVLLFLILTAVNFVMIVSTGRYLLFSIYTCLFFGAAGVVGKEVYGNAMLIACIVIGVIVLAVFFVMWLFSKKHRWAMIVLLVLFSVDCVVLLINVISALAEGSVSGFVDVAVHGAMIYYLILGVRAAGNLQKHFPQGVTLTAEQLNEAYRIENGVDPVSGMPVNSAPVDMPVNPVPGMPVSSQASVATAEGISGEKADSAAPVGYDPMTGEPVYAERTTEANPGSAEPVKPDSPVIEEDTSKRKPLFLLPYNNSQVCVKLSLMNTASLIVDGKVYAREKIGVFSACKSISAVVNGVEYAYEYRYQSSFITHTLYADGKIIAHRGN